MPAATIPSWKSSPRALWVGSVARAGKGRGRGRQFHRLFHPARQRGRWMALAATAPSPRRFCATSGASGEDIHAVMRKVRADVVAATRQTQVPWENSSLVDEVYLASDAVAEAPVPKGKITRPSPARETPDQWYYVGGLEPNGDGFLRCGPAPPRVRRGWPRWSKAHGWRSCRKATLVGGADRGRAAGLPIRAGSSAVSPRRRPQRCRRARAARTCGTPATSSGTTTAIASPPTGRSAPSAMTSCRKDV